jgi:hypothetical protein
MVLRGGAGGLLFFLCVEVVLPEFSGSVPRRTLVVVVTAAAAIPAAAAPPAAKASAAASAPLMLLVHVPRKKRLKRRLLIHTIQRMKYRILTNYDTNVENS